MQGIQGNTALIVRELQTETGIVEVGQRPDGYINITQIAKAAGKQVYGWTRLEDTKEYLAVLSRSTQICVDQLIITISTGPNEQGTWAHPEIAIDIASWCCVEFRIQVNRWVNELRTQGFAVVTEPNKFDLIRMLVDRAEETDLKANEAHARLDDHDTRFQLMGRLNKQSTRGGYMRFWSRRRISRHGLLDALRNMGL